MQKEISNFESLIPSLQLVEHDFDRLNDAWQTLKTNVLAQHTHNSGITAKAQTAVDLMDRLMAAYFNDGGVSSVIADIVHEWEDVTYDSHNLTAAS